MVFQINEVSHPKVGANRFCGPSALSIITGSDTQRTAALLRQVSGRRMITGTDSSHMVSALRQIGYLVENLPVKTIRSKSGKGWHFPTFGQWIGQTREQRGQDVFLVVAGNHFIVVQGNRRCCGQTKEIVFVDDDQPQWQAKLTEVYRITQGAIIKRFDEVIKAKPVNPMASREATAKRKAKKLATQYEIEIELNRSRNDEDPHGPCAVWPGEQLEFENDEDDPYTGDHGAYDWEAVLERVETYVDLIVKNTKMAA